MQLIRCSVLACLAIIGATFPAQAAFHVIYQVLGMYDSGHGANAGIATSIHCTNTGTTATIVRVRVRTPDGATSGTVKQHLIAPQGTFTWSTHATAMFSDLNVDSGLATGMLQQGSAQILVDTSDAIVCAADLLDAANTTPNFVAARRMVRFPRSASGGED